MPSSAKENQPIKNTIYFKNSAIKEDWVHAISILTYPNIVLNITSKNRRFQWGYDFIFL